jgi:hypothetical protein
MVSDLIVVERETGRSLMAIRRNARAEGGQATPPRAVSRNLRAVACDGVEHLVCGLGPEVRPGAVVPYVDPGA